MVKRIAPGTRLPEKVHDNDHGHYVEDLMESEGNTIDRTGTLDLPKEQRDIKSHDIHSKAAYTQGSITKDDMIKSKWKNTNIYKKVQEQEIVLVDSMFNEVKKTFKVDMTHDDIQKKFKEDYKHIKEQIKNGTVSKDIYGPNRYFVGDLHGSENSVRIRIPAKAMNEIFNRSLSAKQFKKHFIEE